MILWSYCNCPFPFNPGDYVIYLFLSTINGTVPGNAQPQAVSLHKSGTAPKTHCDGDLPVWAMKRDCWDKDRMKTLCHFPPRVENSLKEMQATKLNETQATSSMQARPVSLHAPWLGPASAHWDGPWHCQCTRTILHVLMCAITPSLFSSTSYKTHGRASLIPSDFIH